MKWWLALAALLAGCAEAPPRTRAEYPTVVSLNPCADAILAEIAVPGQVLAISHYSHDPAATSLPLDVARRYRSTGGTAEEVLALAPDMVLADSFLAPATARALRQAGVRVEVLGIAGSLEESLAQVQQVGAVTGNSERARALARTIARAWRDQRWAGAPVSALLWQEGGLVPGEGSLAHAMLAQAGFASHSAARGLGQGAYLPLEQVLADPPQVLISAGEDGMLGHLVLSRLEGPRRVTIDPALLYCGGPTIPRALDRLGQIRRSLR